FPDGGDRRLLSRGLDRLPRARCESALSRAAAAEPVWILDLSGELRMAVLLSENNYGKQAVRLVTVRRLPERHELQDVTVAIRFEGDFASAYADGDNRDVFPTDTMKNTVYALAAEHPFDDIEDFGLALTDHFLSHNPLASSVRVDLTEHLWERIEIGGSAHPHAFRKGAGERRIAAVTRDREGARVLAGIEDLVVLKTTKSA